ncbi:MAG: HD domain-containing protein [Alkalicoccus sp.]|nr:MAG: HD domain-containing protein [Alkalicoccus sp.]
MNETEAYEAVRHALKPARYEHTRRVVQTAEELCRKYGGDTEKVRKAAILHDYAKYRPAEEMRRKVEEHPEIPSRLNDYGDELLHAFVGAFFVKEELGIMDEDILQMIAVHTTGRKDMSLEEKILFLADYIEPGRTFSGAEKAREAAVSSLNEGCLTALAQTIEFLVSKRTAVYPDTFEAYNDFIQKRKDA